MVSFFLYSSRFYPLLGSDDALNILMAHYFKFPHDIYCWGQDRGGALIPLISQLFIKLFHLSALNAVSFSNYLILAIGYIGFSSLFKTYYGKLIFAVVWFLPFQRFVELLRYSIGAEYALIGFVIFLICQLDKKATFNNLKSHLLHAAVVILLILAVWVSDLAIISIGILLFTLLVFNYLENKKLVINRLHLTYVIAGTVACFMLINFLKTFSVTKTAHYVSVNNFEQINLGMMMLKKSFFDVLFFKTHEPLIAAYIYALVLFLIFFIIFIIKKKVFLLLFSNKWVSFFMLDFLAIFGAIMLSSWVLGNGMGRWYFVGSYISFSMAVILAVEHFERHQYNMKVFKTALTIIVFIGALSPIYAMKYINPKTLKPEADVAREFEQLGNIGIIAEYWNAYINSVTNPDMIKATPHDKTWPVRSTELIDEVFKQKDIYIIKDMWLDHYPDTLQQYGRMLIKNGTPFNLANCNVCKYRKN